MQNLFDLTNAPLIYLDWSIYLLMKLTSEAASWIRWDLLLSFSAKGKGVHYVYINQ